MNTEQKPIPRISIHEAYGLGAKKIKAVCDLPLPEAEKLIASYRAAHPAAARLFDLTSRRVEAPEPVLGDRGQASGTCCGRQCFGCEAWSAEK